MFKAPDLACGYSRIYREFDSGLMRTIRQKAYGEDIGQHSWVTAEEVRALIGAIPLKPPMRVLDFGCGPCGPLTFVAKAAGCRMVGIDLNADALEAGARRAKELNVEALVELRQADGNHELPDCGNFDLVLCLDVILHLRERTAVLNRLARKLRPGGKLVLTDAGILTGPISNEESALRSINGYTQFVPPGYNENILNSCGFEILSAADRTAAVIENAAGRIAARLEHRRELEQLEGPEYFTAQQKYLQTVVALSERKVLARFEYIARLIPAS